MNNKTDRKSVGQRIKELRKKNNETQKDLADIINSTPNSISKLENGDMGLTFENMLLIAEHFNVSLDYLCKGEGGSNLLETLNKYFSLRYHQISGVDETDNTYPLPVLSIDRAYFDYLIQIANATADSNIPVELKEQWIELETKKFTEGIIHDNYNDFASIIPVSEKLVSTNPELHKTISSSKLKDI